MTVIETSDDMTKNRLNWPDDTSWPVTLEGVAGNELLLHGDDDIVAAINYTFADELYKLLTLQLRKLLNGRT